MVWAHQFAHVGAFSNPGDYRELMKAVVGYSDKTVEQVKAEIDAREKAASSGRKRGGGAAVGAPITKSHVDALAAMQEAAAKAKAEAEQA